MKPAIYLSFIFLLIFFSCTEPLETDYKGKTDNMLIIIGEISTDTTAHKIYLSRTVDYNATGQYFESGATVTISEGENVILLHEVGPGEYVTDSNVFGEVGKEYLLNIETLNGETAQARSEIQPLTDIDSVIVKFEYFPFMEKYFYKILFYGRETPGKGNYYLWNLYLNDSLYNDTLYKSHFESDEFVDGNYIHDFDLYWLEPDDVKSDTMLYTIEMVSLSQDYFQHILDIMLETAWRGGPFDATPANVSSNIEGENASGFFAATCKKRLTVSYIKTEEEKRLFE